MDIQLDFMNPAMITQSVNEPDQIYALFKETNLFIDKEDKTMLDEGYTTSYTIMRLWTD